MTAETITYYRAHFTGEPRARCEQCGTVWAYWEDDELDDHAETWCPKRPTKPLSVHEAQLQARSAPSPEDPDVTTCKRCRGNGGPPSFFDEETGRWHHYVCASCAGSGLMRR